MGSWCTPIVIENPTDGAENSQLVLCSQSTRVVAYRASDGAIVWWCGGMSCHRGDLAYSSPVIANDLCLVTAGYEGPALAIRLGGQGDVTESHRVWHLPRQPNSIGSGVFADGHVFVPDARGFLACIEPTTGKRTWEAQAGKGQIWGSVVHAAGRLYVLNQRGTTTVFAPNPERLDVLASNELGETTNATPAFAEGAIFIRTHEHLYCIAEPAKAK
jgi:outer membrane protein assembly factor BamB